MKVIFLSKKDYANIGYELSKSLNTIGIDSIAYSMQHDVKLSYEERAEKMPRGDELTNLANSANVIVFMHSEHIEIQNLNLSKKKLFVFHGGSLYRTRPKVVNKIFNPIVFGSIIQTGDLLNLGAKNEKWLLPPVAVNKLMPNYNREHDNKMVIGHYPSCKPREKGSYRINKVMSELEARDRFEYRHGLKPILWQKHLKRVAVCDIYIERLSPKYAKCSEWGIAALEAAALGCVVVTNFESRRLYEKIYGPCPIHVVASEKELENAIYNLLSFSSADLLNEKKKLRAWVEHFHTYEKIGLRLLDIIKGK